MDYQSIMPGSDVPLAESAAKKSSYTLKEKKDVILNYDAHPNRSFKDVTQNFKRPIETVKSFYKRRKCIEITPYSTGKAAERLMGATVEPTKHNRKK